MKKVTYVLVLMFSLVLMSTSCCKDDPVPDTLEALYPEWNGFYGVASATPNDATLSITIVGNAGSFDQITPIGSHFSRTFDGINVTGNTINFTESGNDRMKGTFVKNGTVITSFTTDGASNTTYTYNQ